LMYSSGVVLMQPTTAEEVGTVYKGAGMGAE